MVAGAPGDPKGKESFGKQVYYTPGNKEKRFSSGTGTL
jgi:hypothetical protein